MYLGLRVVMSQPLEQSTSHAPPASHHVCIPGGPQAPLGMTFMAPAPIDLNEYHTTGLSTEPLGSNSQVSRRVTVGPPNTARKPLPQRKCFLNQF